MRGGWILIAVLAAAAGGLIAGSRYIKWPEREAAIAPPPVAAISAEPARGASSPGTFVNLARKVVPSVVNISTVSSGEIDDEEYLAQQPPEDIFRRFFEEFMRRRGQDPGVTDPQPLALGTGFVVATEGSSDPLILTNNHVVAGADEIEITFTEDPEEKPVAGEVVGRDADLDVALIRVKTKRALTPLAFGDSDALEVGEYVAAVGNPYGQGHSITHGIISAKGRTSPDFPFASYLQTDAPINPGNSGGPLVNLRGEVIGINNAIDQRAQGIGFAIPSNAVKRVLPQLRSSGTVKRAYIGVLVDEMTPDIARLTKAGDARHPIVTHVFPGDPADRAGLKPYDMILELGGKRIRTSADLINQATALEIGRAAPLKISRAGQVMTLEIRASERKSPAKPSRRNDYGMLLDEAPGQASGVVVTRVAYGGPAELAGVYVGDWILEVDRKPVHSIDDFQATVKEARSYLLRVKREDGFAILVLDLRKGYARR